MNQENVILESDTGEFLLTDRKVRFTIKRWGQLNITSILLKNITSIQIKYKSNPILIALGIICIAIGVISGTKLGFITGIIMGIILLFIYYRSVNRAIKISSASSSILLPIKNLDDDEAINFIDKVENTTLQTSI